MRIHGWTADDVVGGKSGVDYIRIKVPFDELAKHGWKTSYELGVHKEKHGDADVIVGSRIGLPGPAKFWNHACGMAGGPFMVFETDDDYLGISPYNGARHYWANTALRFNYLASMRTAHRVVTSTNYLANLLQDQSGHPDIVVARNTVPGWMLDIPRTENQGLVVGWTGGISHRGDWEWAHKGIRKALNKAPGARFRFIGADFRGMLRVERMEFVPWSDDVGQFWASEALNLDIALAPIAPVVFNRSKSEIKLIEYMARGIPVVASRFGVYAEFVDHGVTGFLAQNANEWTRYILELVNDPDLRHETGAAARLKATGHTIEARVGEYKEAYTP